MPITHQPGTTLAFQQQFRPIGRIRTGMQVEYEKNGRKGKRPARLETFRLTSPDVRMLERAAAAYGGTVTEWPEAPDGDALQLVTEARELDVLVPGGQPLSQWYEMWGTGGCLRRCTGEEETLSGGPCLCPADPADRTELAAKGDACKPTTRVNLLLPDMDLGAWLLVSHSYYAAVELPPVVSLLAGMATQTSRPVAAKLWIDQRRIKRPNQPPKEFSVPAIRTGVTWLDLIAAGGELGGPALGSGRVEAQLPAGDTSLPDDPPATNGHAAPAPETVAGWPVTDAPAAVAMMAVAETPAGEAPEEPAWLGGDEPTPPVIGAPVAGDLVERIRAKARSSAMKGAVGAKQTERLRAIFTPIGGAASKAGLAALWPGLDLNELTAGHAQAIILAADSDAEFEAHWRELASVGVAG